MTTPPKAHCHSCNGTGIDPVTGFLDCEFCWPAFAGVLMSAPEQPAPIAVVRMCNCNQGRLPCTCKPSAYDGFDNSSD